MIEIRKFAHILTSPFEKIRMMLRSFVKPSANIFPQINWKPLIWMGIVPIVKHTMHPNAIEWFAKIHLHMHFHILLTYFSHITSNSCECHSRSNTAFKSLENNVIFLKINSKCSRMVGNLFLLAEHFFNLSHFVSWWIWSEQTILYRCIHRHMNFKNIHPNGEDHKKKMNLFAIDFEIHFIGTFLSRK